MIAARTALAARRARAAALAAAALLAAACAGQPTAEPGGPAVEPASASPGTTAGTAEPADDPSVPPATTPGEPGPSSGRQPGAEPGATGAPGTPRLTGTPSTEERHADPGPGAVALTGVRMASHADFDRVVLEIGGDGAPGWIARYTDGAHEAGRGEEIPVAGGAVLAVALQGVTLPPDLPPGIEPVLRGRWEGPGGVVLEVVSGTVFEAVQTVFLGLDRERPYLIERLEDPQRVVIDVIR